MTAPRIPSFDASSGIHIKRVENGGYVILAQAPAHMMPETIAAFSRAEDLVTALAEAFMPPRPLFGLGDV